MSGFLETYGLILVAALVGGAGAGLLGVFVAGLRVPFLAVCAAHAALAGAVLGPFVGLPSTLSGFVGALGGALALAWVLRHRNVDPNRALGVLFSVMLGLAFLGIGVMRGPRSGALGLLWGNLLFVTRSQVVVVALATLLLVAFAVVCRRSLKVVLFSRELAALLVPEGLILGALLVLGSAVITVNLHIVGGLLLYSLVLNPAVAALRAGRSYAAVLALGSAFGALSAVGGFLAAWAWDLPAGACIVLTSSALVAIVHIATHFVAREA